MRRLTPVEIIELWNDLPSDSFVDEEDRLLAFAGAISDFYLGPQPFTGGTPLNALRLPRYQNNALHRAGYRFVEEVALMSTFQLQRINLIGPHGAAVIRRYLERWSQNERRKAREAAKEANKPAAA